MSSPKIKITPPSNENERGHVGYLMYMIERARSANPSQHFTLEEIRGMIEEFDQIVSGLSYAKVLFAEACGKPIGMIKYYMKPGDTTEIDQLYVHPKFRKMGIASELVKRVVDDSRMMDCKTVRLIAAGDEDLYLFYRKRGFREVGPRMPGMMDLDLRDAQ